MRGDDMANVLLWIDPHENAIRDLPRVCMKCGAPATNVRMKRFTWTPPWAPRFLKKRQLVQVPLCDAHKNYWIIRRAIIAAGFVALLSCCLVTMFAIGLSRQSDPNQTDPVMLLLCLAWMVVMASWSVFVVVFIRRGIRAERITDRDITLTNVSAEFARVLREEDEAYERDLDRKMSGRWRDRGTEGQGAVERIEPASDLPPPRAE
jgi:hypothetical protein